MVPLVRPRIRGVWVLVEGELGGGGQGLGAPVLLVAGERGADLGRVALQHERPGADEGALPLRRVVVVRDDDHVVVVGRRQVREVAVRRGEVEGDGEVVHLDDAVRGQPAAERRQRVGRVLRVGLQLVGVDDVVGGQRGAVVELHALADLERPHVAGGVGRPAVASTGFSVRCWSDRHRYSPVWASMSRPPWSATVSGLIAAVGTTMPALIVAPAAPAPVLAAVLAGWWTAGATAGRDDRAQHGQRDADNGARAQEVPPGEPARGELVDDVVRDFALARAEPAEPVIVSVHWDPP